MSRNLQNWPSFSKQEINAVSEVLKSNKVNYWTGTESRQFEKEFSEWSGSKYSIALANGTVALDLSLKAIGVNDGDEVIVTPRSFIASVSSVVSTGAKPIFADVDHSTGNLNAENIRKKISKRTKAIICVHLGGLPCEMDEIMKLAKLNKLYVIEDCAQAHGATYKGKSLGSIGDIGAWSFCQDKIMTTGGEGGMVSTNNKKLWRTMWEYKDHGKNYNSVNRKSTKQGFRWVHDSFGTNWRMTEMQAAIGRIQLKKMGVWNKLRNRNASALNACLSKFPDLVYQTEVPNYINHAYYRVYAYIKEEALKKSWSRDKIIQKINLAGIPCFSGSCPEIYKEKAFTSSGLRPNADLKNAKSLGDKSIAFLCHPTLTIKDLGFMQENITNILNDASK